MQRIVPFRVFESRVSLTEEQKQFLKDNLAGTWTYREDSGEVDVKGDFQGSGLELGGFMGIQFGRVSGDFYCGGNALTSLAGSPREVGGVFSCTSNHLITLEGGPQRVGRNYWCFDNDLTSLTGAPQEIPGGFDCSGNALTSLKDGPEQTGNFYCNSNVLTSLVGAPREVRGFFQANENELQTLVGAPEVVRGHFECKSNPLTSLSGAPRELEGEFVSDSLVLFRGDWNEEGWLRALDRYRGKNPQASSLLLTLMGPDFWNRKMQESPEQTLIDLGPIWNDPVFAQIRAQIRVPDRYRDEMGLLGDLGELGF